MANETFLLPQAAESQSSGRESSRGLATGILTEGAKRLRVLASLYAFVFFMAGMFPALITPMGRAYIRANPVFWIPDFLAIGMALAVVGFTLIKTVPLRVVMNVGLVFLVVSNYGIAAAEFIDPMRLDMHGTMGLSWVGVWTLLYMMAIPTPPRLALVTMLASVSAVPVTVGFMILTRRTQFHTDAVSFFFSVVLPYLLIVVMGYVGARVVYSLGKQVTRAQELGSYRLIERLGQGGMGQVWRAKHLLLARPAAIKLIRPDALGPSGHANAAVKRFEREAQVTAQLRSPHTVELWDFGIAEDGSFYYVMELLDGMDLDTLVTRHGPVPPERAIHLLRQVCHSLAEAELCGLVHRDIKPANLFNCRYGGDDDFIKVLDFGIVKASHAAADETVLATGGAVLQGTPAFIAPEMALGSGQVDGRADIYASGCVAYWLLTGQLVFTADTPMGIIVHHAHTPPTPPSQRSEIPIPPDLDALIMSCLSKDPAGRPQTARELSDRLARIQGLPEWTEERAREWWTTHRPVGDA